MTSTRSFGRRIAACIDPERPATASSRPKDAGRRQHAEEGGLQNGGGDRSIKPVLADLLSRGMEKAEAHRYQPVAGHVGPKRAVRLPPCDEALEPAQR